MRRKALEDAITSVGWYCSAGSTRDMIRRQSTSPTPSYHAVQDEEAGASDEDDEDLAAGGAALSAAELAGMRVRHSAEELGEGETMVMTLADRPIMDERGQLAYDADELENALVVRPVPWLTPDGRKACARRACDTFLWRPYRWH